MIDSGSTRRVLRCTLVSTLLLGACTGNNGDAERQRDISASGGTTGNGAGGSGGGNVDGGGGNAASSNGSSIGGPVGGILDAGTTDDFDVCAGEESTAVAPGLDMYIVLDHSGSMAQDPDGQNAKGVPDGATLGDCPIDVDESPAIDSRWCLATNALAKFFTGPADRDLRVALQFMTPAENYKICGNDPDNPHATPSVGLSAVPVAADHGLIQALEADYPRLGTTEGVTALEFGTRIEAALNGIVRFTSANQDASRTMVGVLITDGDPNQCEEDLDVLARIVGDHFEATGIPIYIVGMTGATADSLELLAAPGGAPEHGPEFCEADHATCHYWSVGPGRPEAFRQALGMIQETATIPCEYSLPTHDNQQETLDPALVQVKYTPPAGEEQEIVKVASAQACEPGLDGWFYDDPDSPRRILLCPESCDLVTESVSGAKLSLAYGCRPKIR